MPIVTQCKVPGCETLTMGPLCVEHEHLPARVFVRGRPLVQVATDLARPLTATTTAFAPKLRRASERRVAALQHR
jgi:hypothetical protein